MLGSSAERSIAHGTPALTRVLHCLTAIPPSAATSFAPKVWANWERVKRGIWQHQRLRPRRGRARTVACEQLPPQRLRPCSGAAAGMTGSMSVAERVAEVVPFRYQPSGRIHRFAAAGPTQLLDKASDIGCVPILHQREYRRTQVGPYERAQLSGTALLRGSALRRRSRLSPDSGAKPARVVLAQERDAEDHREDRQGKRLIQGRGRIRLVGADLG